MITEFRGLRPSFGHARDAARMSTLYPLLGIPDTHDPEYTVFEQIVHKTFQLQRRWRKCLFEFRQNNWYQIRKGNDYVACLNCRPCFAVFEPRTRLCKQTAICPFCYARHISDLFHKVKRVWLGLNPDYKRDYALIGYKTKILIPPDKATVNRLSMLFEREVSVRLSIYEDLAGFGGYVGADFEPVSDGSLYLIRRGITLSSSTVIPEAYDTIDVRKLTHPNNTSLSRLLAWAFRYPVGLLRYETAPRTVALSHTRHDHRLYASYGLFRSTSN